MYAPAAASIDCGHFSAAAPMKIAVAPLERIVVNCAVTLGSLGSYVSCATSVTLLPLTAASIGVR